jgi:hypothetical protein
MGVTYVVKHSGEREPFDAEKIRRTALRAGATEQLAAEVARGVAAKAYDGISVKAVHKLTKQLLKKHEPHTAARYDLKDAIMRMGPAGFPFETYFAELLRDYGYATQLRQGVRGACAVHEIDVIAEKDGQRQMIECKYHNEPGIRTNLKPALYTYARFLDLREGGKKGACQRFDAAWLVSNTKFSTDALDYANCMGVRVTGWAAPQYLPKENLQPRTTSRSSENLSWAGKNGLSAMIEERRLYPITILPSLNKQAKEAFAAANLMLARDVFKYPVGQLAQKVRLPREYLERLEAEARGICRC